MARLTPRDIQEKEFSSGFRGYKEEDVDEFLDRITSSYEEIFKENIDAKEEIERLGEENKKYELIGERMQAALVAAQETADDVRKNATKEAENILREAEIKAHKMVQESRDQHRELQKSLAIVKQIEEEFRFKLKSTLQSYLKLLDEVAIGDKKEVKKWILPEDMAALGERRREMEEQESPAPPKKEEERKPEAEKAEVQTAEEKKPAAAEAPPSVEDTAGKLVDKPEDTAPVPKITALEEEKTSSKKAEEETAKKTEDTEKAEPPDKEAMIEDSKAKAAKLLEEIAAQAAEEKKAEEAAAAAAAIKPPAPKKEESPVKKIDEPPAKATAEQEQAGQPSAKKTEGKIPFDQDAGKASAVSAEWNKLQEAVDEAVKATEKPTRAEKEAKAAESTMPGEMVEKAPPAKTTKEPEQAPSMKAGEPRQAEPAKTTEPEPKAKDESKGSKTGKSALEDIEIVEDESFWKDI
jgi:cell division initiation protein